MSNSYKGISFPFRFGVGGGVQKSELTPEDFSRIRESIHQIIFTYLKERVNENHIGSRLKEYLFESYEDINTLGLIKFEVEKAISEQEPRVNVLDVRVYTLPGEEGKIYIDVDVEIIQFATEATFSYNFTQNVA